jgi:AcrR family transcriptional regulator
MGNELPPSSDARNRVCRAAERLFSERGYAAVTMRDIADAVGIRQASLYHHMPEGKEQLFAEVIERALQRHSGGLRAAISAAPEDLRSQLRAVVAWLLEQPPLDLSRLFRSDLPALSEERRQRIVKTLYNELLTPMEELFTAAYQRGEIRIIHKTLATVTLFSVIETLHDIDRYIHAPKHVLGIDVVDTLLDGLRRR